MLPAFQDKRYMKVNGKNIFLIWDAIGLADPSLFFKTWNTLAKENGLEEFYFIGFTFKKEQVSEILEKGFNSVCVDLIQQHYRTTSFLHKSKRKIRNICGLLTPKISTYDSYATICKEYFFKKKENIIPCILPNWDHSPRSKENATILINSTPNKFIRLLSEICEIQSRRVDDTKNIVFIKSWNEWGEGNYLEPDLQYGDSYIKEMELFSRNYF